MLPHQGICSQDTSRRCSEAQGGHRFPLIQGLTRSPCGGLDKFYGFLEGRRSHDYRSLDLHRLSSRFYTVYIQCERRCQKMLRTIYSSFGKRCHVFLPLIAAKTVAFISRQEVTLLNKLYLISLIIGNVV